MACNGMNGFEKDDTTSLGRQWVVSGSNYTMPATGRRTTTCLRYQPNSTTIHRSVTYDETYHFGFAFYYESGYTGTATTYQIATIGDSPGNVHLRLMLVHGTKALSIQNNAFSTLWTSNTLLIADTWYYLEWSTKCATAGTSAVYINGSATADATEYSGDTQNGSNTISIFSFGNSSGVSNSPFFKVGDWYANSATGAIAKDNTRWGDTKIVGYLPNAAGTTNGLVSITTGTAAATNVNEVDDATTDDDSTYVYGTSAADSYNFPALGFTPQSIQAVATRITAKKTDAGARTIAARVRSGTVPADNDTATQAIGTSYLVYEFIHPQEPEDGASWTQSTYEAAEFGVVVA